jgi:hypothetical protein
LRAQRWRLQRLPDDRDAAIAGRAGIELRGRRHPTGGTRDRELATVLPPPARTVDNLIALYRASDSFTRLRPATKRGYE